MYVYGITFVRYATEDKKQELEQIICNSLEQNNPVIFKTALDEEATCIVPETQKSYYLRNHFITITGIEIDSISQQTKITFSTWAREANADFIMLIDGSFLKASMIYIE